MRLKSIKAVAITVVAILFASTSFSQGTQKTPYPIMQTTHEIPFELQGKWLIHALSFNKGVNFDTVETFVGADVSDNSLAVPGLNKAVAIRAVTIDPKDEMGNEAYYISFHGQSVKTSLWEVHRLPGSTKNERVFWLVKVWNHDGESLVENLRYLMTVQKN